MAVHRRISTVDLDHDDTEGSASASTPTSPLLPRRSFQRPPMQRLPESEESSSMASSDIVQAKVAYSLYLCHFLSTWNARIYEFAAVLFTASAFPQDLLASSIFGMVMSLSILCFASLLGTWVDRASSRLATLCSTIIANRVSVIASCLCWLVIVGDTANGDVTVVEPTNLPGADVWLTTKKTIFVFIMIFGIIERVSRTANIISVERDWVPTLAPPTVDDASLKFGLTQMNAVMSRIDLVCKLLSPIAISSFVAAVGSMRIAAIALLILNGATFPAEIATARVVWNSNSRLRIPKEAYPGDIPVSPIATASRTTIGDDDIPFLQRLTLRIYRTLLAFFLCIKIWLLDYRDNLNIYFTYRVWVPSMALSILHFSVLNYSATLTVYLLNSGFSMNVITMARAFSSVWEIGSTFFYPLGVRLCGRYYEKVAHSEYDPVVRDEDGVELLEVEDREEGGEIHRSTFKEEVDMGVATLGLWALIQMWLCLLPAVFALWTLSVPRDPSSPLQTHSAFITILLLTTIPTSRFGRWLNHLNTQQLTQTLVPPSHRSGFAGAETGFVSLFGLMHWVVTATWSAHEHFKWLALGSVVAVTVSWSMYWWWLRRAKS